ncbi:hypothetical protein [Quatrionicoccus australiensis]|uniref:hypothetical protein n=1 Tax=Quatrionicoccus australiensis TaxID=138118 RepID=UPI001CF97F49|nr:hypothetical protein [Quatrionicoccus australiensis]MCB4358456.1 hypothetical protein [Quatrionicoccus australiensis]
MQAKLFYDDEYEALNLMVSNSQKSAKELAVYLFPHLKMDSAYARLKSCLNPEKDERLTFGQIIAAMNFCECYDPLAYACDETMHGRPDRKAPEDEEVKIVEAMNSAAAVMQKAMRQLEHLQARTANIRRAA